MPSPGTTSWPSHPPGRARPWRSSRRSSTPIDPGARRPAALVLAPTRELAAQIVDDARPLAQARGLKTLAVFGGVGIQPQIQKARKAHLLVATPGRLLDLLDRRALTLEHVQVDGPRRGRPDARHGLPPRRRAHPEAHAQVAADAALLGHAGQGEVDGLAKRHTRNARRHENRVSEDSRPDIEHRFVGVEHQHKLNALVNELKDSDDGLALVFVRTRRGADRLAKRLSARGVNAAAMHGGKAQGNRTRTLAAFEAGRLDALIATDVAARGIDVRGITHVINFDPPEDRDGYVHRIGRTARAGRSGVGVTFVMADQAHEVGRIARALDLAGEFGAVPHGGRRHAGRGRTRSRSR